MFRDASDIFLTRSKGCQVGARPSSTTVDSIEYDVNDRGAYDAASISDIMIQTCHWWWCLERLQGPGRVETGLAGS